MTREASTFTERLQAVETRLEQASLRSGRERSNITLVAVTKKFPVQVIRGAYAAGVRHFGENYLQEFATKADSLLDLTDATFHLIGHLQSNKTRQACKLFSVIETVDSVRLLERMEAICAVDRMPRKVLVEVKLSEEATKSGASPADLDGIMQRSRTLSHVIVDGLMTVPPWSENAEQSRPYFRELCRLAKLHGLPQLSMGMSNDFEVAIEEGATAVRVGTALFGSRPKPPVDQSLSASFS